MDRELREALQKQAELKRILSEEPFLTLKPTHKQLEFINSRSRETALFGLNQGGKTIALLIKGRNHITGLYPKGYSGHRFTKPITAAMAGVTAQTTRDLLVNRLFGDPRRRGTGYLPKGSFNPSNDIIKIGGNVSDQVDYAYVDWHDENGKVQGKSKVYFFAYKMGAERVMGYPLDWVGVDEECDFDVYDELSARLNATGGFLDLSMTPMQGETSLYLHFVNSENHALRRAIFYDIREATWMDDEKRAELEEKYLHHPYREARLYGRAVAGRGLIYPCPDELIACEPFEIPRHYKIIIGVDFPHTTGHFASVKLAYDKQNDVVYVVDYYRRDGQVWSVYAQRVSQMGGRLYPVAWPSDGMLKGVDRGNKASSTIVSQYKSFGLNMLSSPAHSIDSQGKKNTSIGPTIDDICERMATGRFKVFSNLHGWFKEKSQYRHDGTRILETNHFEPDGLDATHKAMMMIRFAKPAHGDTITNNGVGDLWSNDFFGGAYTERGRF